MRNTIDLFSGRGFFWGCNVFSAAILTNGAIWLKAPDMYPAAIAFALIAIAVKP